MKLKLLHKSAEVVFIAEPKDPASGSPVFGLMDFANSRIVLAKNIKPDNQKEVLLHEVIHAVDELLSIGLREKEVHQLSVGLYTVLKENPNLRKFLFS